MEKKRLGGPPNFSNPTQCIAKHRDVRRTRGEGEKEYPRTWLPVDESTKEPLRKENTKKILNHRERKKFLW